MSRHHPKPSPPPPNAPEKPSTAKVNALDSVMADEARPSQTEASEAPSSQDQGASAGQNQFFCAADLWQCVCVACPFFVKPKDASLKGCWFYIFVTMAINYNSITGWLHQNRNQTFLSKDPFHDMLAFFQFFFCCVIYSCPLDLWTPCRTKTAI